MIEAVNQAEAVLHDIESKMEEFKSQLPADEVSLVEVGRFWCSGKDSGVRKTLCVVRLPN